MALTYGFYNSIEGDRVYDAIQFGRIFDGIIKDGVYATYEKGMMVIASSNPSEVIIQPGRAWFNHTWSYNDANVIFEAPAPEVLLERYDALVLEINEELSSRENSYKWVQGTPSSRPERPTLTNTTTIHQYPLCYVHRYPETTMIYTRDITNMIGTSECPFATGVLEGIDLDAWINQWDDEFHTWENSKKTQFEAWMLSQETAFTAWYNAFKDQMASDVQEVEDFVDYLESVLDASTAVHLQEEIDELKNEISSGSHITVTTINPELYGRNVTITEAGGTVFTEKFDNTGVAVFKSVPYVGNLTISSTYGTQTAERVVNTPYYARYEFAIAFWAATVNIVSDPEMAGSSVTVKDSEEAIVGTVVLDSEGAGVYTAIKPDTYKFTLTYGGQTMEVTLSVTQETTYTVDLHADRFRWENWVDASKTLHSTDYDSLDEVLADEKAVRELMTIHACVDYLANIDEDDEDVKTIIENDLCAKWINNRDYALDTLYANTVIKEYMDNSLAELKGQVPVMTSNTTPSGVASASSAASGYDAYQAFSSDSARGWVPAGGQYTTSDYLRYQFVSPIMAKKAHVLFMPYNQTRSFKYKIQASNTANSNDWTDVSDEIQLTAPGGGIYEANISLTSSQKYLYYQFVPTTSDTTQNAYGLKLQFYAYEYSSKYFLGEWTLMPQVPKMTSNNAPYGEASASSVFGSGLEAYRAFDGDTSTRWGSTDASTTATLTYKFTNPICAKRVFIDDYVTGSNIATLKDFEIQASNDGFVNDVHILYSGTENNTYTSANHNAYYVDITNDDYYLYYRLNMKTKYVQYGYTIWTLQFYAWQPKGNVPVMTSNTAPYGTAGASNQNANAYQAFNGSDYGYDGGSTAYSGTITYAFTNPICPSKVSFRNNTNTDGNVRIYTYKVEGYDGSSWEDLTETLSVSDRVTVGALTEADISTTKYYTQLRLNMLSGSQYIGCAHLQFYGRELKVSVPVMTSATLPYGEVIARDYETNYEAWRAFNPTATNWFSKYQVNPSGNYIGYKFNHKVVIKMAIYDTSGIGSGYTAYIPKTVKLQGADDDNYLDIGENKSLPQTISKNVIDYSDNTEAYNNIRFYIVEGWSDKQVGASGIQFYGLDYSEREFEEGSTKKWLYDHGVELVEMGVYTQSGTAEKNSNSLYVQGNSGNYNCEVHTNNAIDLTSYSLFRAKIDKALRTVILRIGNAIPINWGEGSKIVASNDLLIPLVESPNNLSLDISSVNGFNYPTVSSGSNGYVEVTELWLE